MRRVSWLYCTTHERAVEICNALLVAGASIINVNRQLGFTHEPEDRMYEVWYEHERAGDDAFAVEITRAARDVKDYEAKKTYWDQQYRESHDALDTLSETIGNPCLEMQGDETSAAALVRYVTERYIHTDATWREINGLPPIDK